MFKQYLYIFGVAFIVCLADCAPPNGLNICKSDDSKCHVETTNMFMPVFANGLPDYGVKPLDPLMMKSVNASEGVLLFLVNDVTVNGLKNCKAIEMGRNNENNKMHLTIKCTATLDGDYVLDGTIISVPFKGNGKIHVDLNSAKINVEIETEVIVGEDGKKHWNIKSYQHTFDLEEKSNIVLKDLFNGNAVLAEAADTMIKNNSNEVIKSVGSTLIKHIIDVIAENIKTFFKVLPIEDLSID